MVEEPAPASNLYINPSLPIVSMKPADPAQNVSATLVGGTAEDKYGFVWSADNYNVIDLTYSANTAIITPRQEGKAEITISHPKAPYDAKIVVRVTEYSQFAFPVLNDYTREQPSLYHAGSCNRRRVFGRVTYQQIVPNCYDK